MKQDEGINYITDENNRKIVKLDEITNNMNTYFCEIGTNLSNKIKSTSNSEIKLPIMNEKTILLKPNQIEIFSIIKNMKNKSGGVDNINTRTLKAISEYIADPLIYAFNLCIQQSVWPDILKKAEIVPIFKLKDRHKAENYRLIFLISNIAKVFEKSIYNRLFKFISKDDIISQ